MVIRLDIHFKNWRHSFHKGINFPTAPLPGETIGLLADYDLEGVVEDRYFDARNPNTVTLNTKVQRIYTYKEIEEGVEIQTEELDAQLFAAFVAEGWMPCITTMYDFIEVFTCEEERQAMSMDPLEVVEVFEAKLDDIIELHERTEAANYSEAVRMHEAKKTELLA